MIKRAKDKQTNRIREQEIKVILRARELEKKLENSDLER